MYLGNDSVELINTSLILSFNVIKIIQTPVGIILTKKVYK